jgi:hypothetical protein
MTKKEVMALREVLSHLSFDRASFSHIIPSLDPPEMALPTSEQEVDRFVKARTRLYINSWCKPAIKDLLAKYDKWTVPGSKS